VARGVIYITTPSPNACSLSRPKKHLPPRSRDLFRSRGPLRRLADRSLTLYRFFFSFFFFSFGFLSFLRHGLPNPRRGIPTTACLDIQGQDLLADMVSHNNTNSSSSPGNSTRKTYMPSRASPVRLFQVPGLLAGLLTRTPGDRPSRVSLASSRELHLPLPMDINNHHLLLLLSNLDTSP
jgi:hypothetical protein